MELPTLLGSMLGTWSTEAHVPPIPYEILSSWRNWQQIQAMASAQVRALFLRIMISYVSGGFPHRGKYFKYVSARDSLGQNVVFPSNGIPPPVVVLYCNQTN